MNYYILNYIFSCMVALAFLMPCKAEKCGELDNFIKNNEDNLKIKSVIYTRAIEFLNTADENYLKLLKCPLQYSSNIEDSKVLSEIIDEIVAKINLLPTKNQAHIVKTSLERFQTILDRYEQKTNEIYLKNMNTIEQQLSGENRSTPQSIFPSYDTFLRLFEKKAPKTDKGVINFLLAQKKLDEDVVRQGNDAQRLYYTLNRLGNALAEMNKKSRIDLVNNNKRKQQIKAIDTIKNALVGKYGDAVTNYSMNLSNDKDAVVVANIALVLNKIIKQLNGSIKAAMEEK